MQSNAKYKTLPAVQRDWKTIADNRYGNGTRSKMLHNELWAMTSLEQLFGRWYRSVPSVGCVCRVQEGSVMK